MKAIRTELLALEVITARFLPLERLQTGCCVIICNSFL